MKIQVQYDVPVSATVDLAAGTVEDVRIWPTAIESRDGEHDFVVVGTQLPATIEQRMEAREIAEAETWPAWMLA